MTQIKKDDAPMFRLLKLCSLGLAFLALVSCGGGANSNPPAAVNLSASSNATLVQVEMFKDIAPDMLNITVSLSSNSPNDVDPTVGTVNLTSYEVTYTRRTTGVSLDPITGPLGQTVTLSGGSSVTFDVIVFHTETKLFSAFADEFRNSLVPVTFDCRMTIRGRNNAGTDLSRSFGFELQAGVFEPTDSLVPSIAYFNQTTDHEWGEDYFANWRTEGRVDSAAFLLPWGDQLNIPGNLNYFPLGSLSIGTGGLPVDLGATETYDSGILIVSNPWGTVQSTASDTISVTRTDTTPVDVPVNIQQFFSDVNTVDPGDPVTLTWVITGDVESLEILPEAYGGTTVDFSGLDLSFGSVTINPTESVRPILKAIGPSSTDTSFLAQAITVQETPTVAPAIQFLRTDRTTVQVGRSVNFYWSVTGDIDRVELFPFNGLVFDVTDVNSFVSPPFADEGTYTFTMIVYGTDGSIARQDITITATRDFNNPVEITSINQQPGSGIPNGTEASLSFVVSDPDRRDSSWRIRKIAGDSVSFFPREGQIPTGFGPASVAINDGDDNDNGFLTFELSAYDDTQFGFSGNSTRDIQLVTFNTNGVLSDTAPTISPIVFTASGPETAPGTEGSITFTIADQDTLDLSWQIFIVAGDTGGTFTQRNGTTDTGSAQIQITYNDDPDTPTEPVVFLVRVDEVGATGQYAIQTLRVDKGSGATDGTTTTENVIDFPLSALYGNFEGEPDTNDILAARTIYFNGDLVNPRFFRNPDLSGEVVGLSYVVDLIHEGGDPGVINNVTFVRDFIDPSTSAGNTGNLAFVNYFPSSGSLQGGSPTPIAGGVARYRMTFTVEDFRGDSLNLPTVGSSTYNIVVTAFDTNGESVQLSQNITVSVP